MDITSSYLVDKALEVRDAYLNDHQIPVEVVARIAVEDSLNEEQLRRLCEASNVAIKRYLTYDMGDPQATFPVIDWKEVVKMVGNTGDKPDVMAEDLLGDEDALKTASLISLDDLLGTDAVNSDEWMKKTAYEAKARTQRTETMQRIEALQKTAGELDDKEMNLALEAERAMLSVYKTLREDAIKKGHVNEAYTIALDKVGMKYNRPEAVDDLFNKMRDVLNRNTGVKVAALSVEPVIGTINPNWHLLGDVAVYITASEARSKIAAIRDQVKRNIDKATAQMFGLVLE